MKSQSSYEHIIKPKDNSQDFFQPNKKKKLLVFFVLAQAYIPHNSSNVARIAEIETRRTKKESLKSVQKWANGEQFSAGPSEFGPTIVFF